ncbi:MAG: AMP-binding protein [Clostridiales Family XIII bacterium]|jgi:long-chain acyl-CoA synthetase|nr:AMP-binding protein [Clostridiales Family XIII bacterium]
MNIGPYPYNKAPASETLRELLEYFSQRGAPGDTVLVHRLRDPLPVTRGQLMQDVRRFSARLHALGLSGKQVAVATMPGYAGAVAMLAGFHAGAVVVPLDVQLPPGRLCQLVADSDAQALLYGGAFETVREGAEAGGAVRHFCCLDGPDFGAWLRAGEGAPEAPAPAPSDLAVIMYTSGTTGAAKGVMLTQHSLVSSVLAGIAMHEMPETNLAFLPFFHIFGVIGLLMMVGQGLQFYMSDGPAAFLGEIARYRPQQVLMVPAMARAVMRRIEAGLTQDLGDVNLIICGGARVPAEIPAFYRGLGIDLLNAYGLTETTGMVASTRRRDYRDGSVGRAYPNTDIRIAGGSAAGGTMIAGGAPGAAGVGEIQMRGVCMCKGYYKRPDLTKELYTEDGWLRTGDLGYLDEDGYLFITGRIGNLIVLDNGYNVSPEEVESLASSDERIAEIVVYESDGAIAAEIFPAYTDGMAEEGKARLRDGIEDGIRRLNETLPFYMSILKTTFRDEPFPKTTTNKIKRGQAH